MVVTEFIFFDAAGHPLFVRMDAEQANWQEDELSLTAVFPYIDGKVIRRGMRIGFEDQDGVLQPFEIRKVKNYEKDHRQELTCEHIAIAELTDVHYSGSEHENITAQAALSALLAAQPEALGGNRWQIGNVTASGISSGDLSMGSVWQNVRTIEQNWNVYITPRVTFGTAGIAGRYLDISPAGGVWRGIRLSLDVNADEVGVTIDDTETLTALYGYGGNAINQETGAASTEKVTFASVTWAKTADHPAKPEGQTYLEDADATRDFGRNGQPRFGFYQNGDITDPALLLQKTWEALKATNHPRVTVDCLLKELVRYGYRGQAVRLHDLVHVELRPMGFVERLEVIKRGVNLLDPTATRVTIGAYIPNIVYIQRQTSFQALGASVTTSRRRGYGSGKSAQSDKEAEWSEYRTRIEANNRKIELAAEHVDKANRILEAAGIGINTDGVVVYATDNVNKIGSRFQVEADKISAVVGATGITDPADLVWRFGELYKVIGRDAEGNPTMFEKVTSQQAQLTAIKQTADGVSAEVATARGNSTLKSVLDLKENTATLAVIKDTNGNISAAKIVAEINKTTGDSNAIIQADHVYLDANKTANIGNSFYMNNGQIWIKKTVMIGDSNHVTFNNGTMNAPTVQVNSGGALKFSPSSQIGTVISIDHAKASGLLTEVQIAQPASGSNTYTLQYKKVGGGDTWFTPANGTFSRAIASWTAVAGNGAVTMTANPQGQSLIHAVKPILVNNHIRSNFTSNVYKDEDKAANLVSGIQVNLVANTTNGTIEAQVDNTAVAELPVSFAGNVTLGNWEWNSYTGNMPSTRTVSIAASDSGGGTDSASLSMTLSQGAWGGASGEGLTAYQKYVSLVAPATNGSARARVLIDAGQLVSNAETAARAAGAASVGVAGSWSGRTYTATTDTTTTPVVTSKSTTIWGAVIKSGSKVVKPTSGTLKNHLTLDVDTYISGRDNGTEIAASAISGATRTLDMGAVTVDGAEELANAGDSTTITVKVNGVPVGSRKVTAAAGTDQSGNVTLSSMAAGTGSVSYSQDTQKTYVSLPVDYTLSNGTTGTTPVNTVKFPFGVTLTPSKSGSNLAVSATVPGTSGALTVKSATLAVTPSLAMTTNGSTAEVKATASAIVGSLDAFSASAATVGYLRQTTSASGATLTVTSMLRKLDSDDSAVSGTANTIYGKATTDITLTASAATIGPGETSVVSAGGASVSVTGRGLNLKAVTITPSTSVQTINVPSGYDGHGTIRVEAAAPSGGTELSTWTWTDSGSSNTENTVSTGIVGTSTTKDLKLVLTQNANWDASYQKRVYLRDTSTQGNLHASILVDAGSVYQAGVAAGSATTAPLLWGGIGTAKMPDGQWAVGWVENFTPAPVPNIVYAKGLYDASSKKYTHIGIQVNGQAYIIALPAVQFLLGNLKLYANQYAIGTLNNITVTYGGVNYGTTHYIYDATVPD